MWPDIFEKIQRIKSLDKNFVIYGADVHRYQIPPVIGTAELAKVEDRLGVSLPVELRQLYLEWGNGGVGPDYGLYSIEHLESVRPDSAWPGVDALNSGECSIDDLAGVIAVMDRYYNYRTYVVCNGAHCGQVIAFEEDQFAMVEAASLHEVYSTWLKKELSIIDWYIAALRSTIDICELAAARQAKFETHTDNSLLICASLLDMQGFTLADAQAASHWRRTDGTDVFIVSPDLRHRFNKQIERLAHVL